MNTIINPEGERIRAQAILRSFTEYNEAVELFARPESDCEQVETVKLSANRQSGNFIMRVVNAIKLNRRHGVDHPVPSPAYLQVTRCSE